MMRMMGVVRVVAGAARDGIIIWESQQGCFGHCGGALGDLNLSAADPETSVGNLRLDTVRKHCRESNAERKEERPFRHRRNLSLPFSDCQVIKTARSARRRFMNVGPSRR
jgi:hypothetical protein